MEEIYMKRPHSGIPWGFRIVGGSESQIPIIVSKVLNDSIAQKSGLEEEVILERVNNVPTSSLTHAEVNEIIIAAGDELLFTVKRENLENYIRESPALKKDESARMSSIEENEEEECRETPSSCPYNSKDHKGLEPAEMKREYGIPMMIDNQNKVRELSSYRAVPAQLQEPPKGKTWSTFLQKPKNPPPRPFNQPPPIPKENLYRVVIRKQNKTDEIDQQKCEEFSENTEQTLNENSGESTNEAAIVDEKMKSDEMNENQLETTQNVSNNREPPIEDQNEKLEENLEEISLSNENECNLEERNHMKGTEECPIDYDELFEGLISETAEMEGPLSETLSDIHEESEQLEDVEEIHEEREKDEQQLNNNNVETQTNQIEKEEPKIETYFYETESEENYEDQTNKGTIRPIILPGGRKWVDPEDAVPMKAKTRKMSDNTISSTIETFSEVIVGKTKGINFMKYTPPAKNLDYLKKSAVYRLIHEMEPPVRGISGRPEKVLAERDYYSDEN